MKLCTKCNIEKDESLFHKQASHIDGLRSWCKKCVNEHNAIYKKENKEKNKECNKKYYLKNIDERKMYSEQYRQEHKSQIAVRQKIYNDVNKVKLNEYQKQYSKERRITDVNFKLKTTFRNRIRTAIKAQYGNKAHKSIELLGCTIDVAKKHIETQWTEGMSWENHGRGKGKWQIDHIIPCDAFDLTNPTQQKECFNYSNLQPLWQIDNIKKSNKIVEA